MLAEHGRILRFAASRSPCSPGAGEGPCAAARTGRGQAAAGYFNDVFSEGPGSTEYGAES